MAKKMRIVETFQSIQGEGIHSGLPTYFVRLEGCNLRCSYCDTKYAYKDGVNKTITEVASKIKKQKLRLICITGGEPLLQSETKDLVGKLIRAGYEIDIETNGSIAINSFPNSRKIMYSLDIKCPSSGMSRHMNYNNLNYLKKKDQIKFIIKNKNDYNFSKRIIEKYNLNRKTNIIFTPVGGIKADKLVSWILRDGLNVRIGLQIHKVIWGSKRAK